MERNLQLSLRKPEGNFRQGQEDSIERMFTIFCYSLEKVVDKHTPDTILNVDESGFATVQKSMQMVIAFYKFVLLGRKKLFFVNIKGTKEGKCTFLNC